ncbi:start control protein Cdc10 [Phlyctema vagabunda]|uniref:Start control protein Cdc10 n=1 Tax=Phlyctema vagabunda TaxID=108571 RepID=A0ABR4P598_9HELO
MASATFTANPQPLATTSFSRQNHLNHQTPYPPVGGDSTSGPRLEHQMSFSMSQGSQGGLMMQAGGSFRQYGETNGLQRANSSAQIYSAVYSGVDVYEMEVNGIAVMRRRKDSWLNATQILKVAGIEKGKRTKILEKEILTGEYEKVQGGYGKYQGTWIKFERGLEFCRQYGVEELLRALLTYDMGQDGGIAGRGGIDTPTKEQAMAAQRKRLYNSGMDSRGASQSGTFFKNISSTASHAVAAISKARFDSPGVRSGNMQRPASFSRQSSQQQLASQESAFPGGSQQSMQSFTSDTSFSAQPQSAPGTQQSGPQYSFQAQNDFQEPPRKRLRPSPGINDSQRTMDAALYDQSMRDVSPTEPNESFVYHSQPFQVMPPGEDYPMTLSPLPTPTEAKKSILMSLFTDPGRTNFRDHEAFTSLTDEDLDVPIDNSLHTALHWAATLARIPLLKALIHRGASIYRVNGAGETALMRACVVTNNLDMGSFPDLLELLGPIIELRDARGRTVLHHIAVTSAVKGRSQASKYYLESLLEFVVRQGSAPSSQQSFGAIPPPKPMGIGRFMSEMVNVQDNSGDTALNLAARIGNRSIISQLLEVGADAGIPNRSNLCPCDFGIGDPNDASDRGGNFASPEKPASEREKSGDIITSIASLLSGIEKEFTKEMDSKQAIIDSYHSQLRESSADLGTQRRRLEVLQARVKEIQERKVRIANLKRAREEESNRTTQMLRQHGHTKSDTLLRLGDADKNFAINPETSKALESITLGQALDQTQKALMNTLPSASVLRATLNAYQNNNSTLEERAKELKSKSTDLGSKYRRIISLCTGVEETKVDGHLDNLMRAVESEQNDVELGRVRDFLQRVDGPE